MWSTDVYWKAWLLLSKAGSSPSLREEDSSLRSGSRRWRQLLHAMESISLRFTTPMDHWRRTDFIARRNGRQDEWVFRVGIVDCRQSEAAMTQIRMEDSSTERTQRICARVAGFRLLWVFINGLGHGNDILYTVWVCR